MRVLLLRAPGRAVAHAATVGPSLSTSFTEQTIFKDIFRKSGFHTQTKRTFRKPIDPFQSPNPFVRNRFEKHVQNLKEKGEDPEEWITVYRNTKPAESEALRNGVLQSDGSRLGIEASYWNTTNWSRSTHISGEIPDPSNPRKSMWVSTSTKPFINGFGLLSTRFEVQRKYCFFNDESSLFAKSEREVTVITGAPIRNLKEMW